MTTDSWDAGDDAQARQAVQGILRLAASDEACRILGVDGTLEDEVDVAFVAQPLDWIASEIANALRQAENEEDEDGDGGSDEAPTAVSLSTIVALVRLAGILRGAPLNERELADAVLESLTEG